MDGTQVLTVPVPQLAVWRPELVLAATVLVGLVAAAWFRTRLRLVVLAGLAIALGAALTSVPPAAVAPLGPHFLVDRDAALTRVVIIALALVARLVLRPRNEAASGTLALATLGCVWLAEAATLAGLLVATATIIVGAGATAQFAGPVSSRAAVARWFSTAGLGFGILAFAGTLWCGMAGTLDLAQGVSALGLRPSLPPSALPVLLSLTGAGLALALLGEPGRFRPDPAATDGPRFTLDPVLTAWLTIVPALALVTMLGRVLRAVPAAPPLAAMPGLVEGLAGVLILGGFATALANPRLERRLAWAAAGQTGLALLGFAVLPDRADPTTPLRLLLAFAPAQLGAMLIAGVLVSARSDSRWRVPQLVILSGLLLSLAALPPLAGWRPRLDLLADLLAADRYSALALATVGTLLGCVTYLRPLIELWREDTGDADTGEGWPVPATLLAAGLLVVLLAWGLGFWSWNPLA